GGGRAGGGVAVAGGQDGQGGDQRVGRQGAGGEDGAQDVGGAGGPDVEGLVRFGVEGGEGRIDGGGRADLIDQFGRRKAGQGGEAGGGQADGVGGDVAPGVAPAPVVARPPQGDAGTLSPGRVGRLFPDPIRISGLDLK